MVVWKHRADAVLVIDSDQHLVGKDQKKASFAYGRLQTVGD